MNHLFAMCDEAAALLHAQGIDEARREARRIMALALQCDEEKLWLRDDEVLSPIERQKFNDMVASRLDGRVVARLVGEREFWSLPFAIDDTVLDPRPESETLIELAIELMRDANHTPHWIVDMGIGSGCLLAALLSHYGTARGVGVDCSMACLRVADTNMRHLGLSSRVHLVCGDWAHGWRGAVDVVIANPPYVTSDQCAAMPKELTHDPLLALHGGADGLHCYEALFASLKGLACHWLIVEVGASMAHDVITHARRHDFHHCATKKDIHGIERALAFVVSSS